jgi:hypothetical protein
MQDLLNTNGTLIIIGFFILMNAVFIGLAIYGVYRRRIRTREAWDQLAMRTGLSLEPGNLITPPKLSGEYRRRPAVLTTYTRGSGRSSTTYTLITLTVQNSGGGALKLTPQGLLDGIGKALGIQDVTIGDERFDKHFEIRSQPADFAMAALDDGMLRDGLIRLSGRFVVALNGTSLTYTEPRLLFDVDNLEMLFNILSDLADKLDGGSRKSAF